MKDETSSFKTDSKDDQTQTRGSETSKPSGGTKLMNIGKGNWISPDDVRSIRTLANTQPTVVCVDLANGSVINIKFYHEQDALNAAERLAEAINKSVASD